MSIQEIDSARTVEDLKITTRYMYLPRNSNLRYYTRYFIPLTILRQIIGRIIFKKCTK